MLFKLTSRESQALQVLPKRSSQTVARIELSNEDTPKETLRRQMYERMARGNALAEAEENANRKWHGQ